MDKLEDYVFEGGPDAGVLHLDGQMTLENSETVKAALLAALERCRALTLDLSGVTKADLSFLQLLCAADRSAKARGGCVAGLRAMSDAVSSVARAAGFDMLDPEVVGISLFKAISR